MKGYVVCVYENIKDQEILKDYAVKAKMLLINIKEIF